MADLEGPREAAPRTLATASDITVQCLRWSRWGGERATGRGVARVLVCTPTCANGREDRVAARVTLRRRKRCGDERWYRTADVTLESDAPRPKSYVRAPC